MLTLTRDDLATLSRFCRILRRGAPTTAEDARQEAALRLVVTGLPLPTAPAHRRAVLWIYARWATSNMRRRAMRWARPLIPLPSWPRSPDERLELMAHALTLLPPPERAAVLLWVEGVDGPRAAELHACPVRTHYSRVYRALRRLRALVNRWTR